MAAKAQPKQKQIYLITGGGTGFGALSARALAREGHTVYAGMYSHDGNTSPAENDIKQFNEENDTDLRPLPLNLLSQENVDAAVKAVLEQAKGLDAVIHNAGHMCYGAAEAFTPEQYLRLYDVNVVGAQRLNTAVLPHFREKRRGHLIWISSSSVYGAKSPYLGGYFAAKAAFDSLAQTYARELHPWGIETTILNPGVFTKGTSHFTDAMKPGNEAVARQYDDGPTKDVGEKTLVGTAAAVPDSADPSVVADALVVLSRIDRGLKPYRVTVDPADDGGKEVSAIVDRMGSDFYKRLGLEELLRVML